MDLNLLKVFEKVADQQSFTKAAKLLKMPKSNVSQKVAALESHLGANLLIRTTRKVSLTDVGHQVFEIAKDINASAMEVEQLAETFQATPTGHLKISVSHDLGVFLLKEFIPDFHSLYPEVQIEFDLANRKVDLIAEGYDLALRFASGKQSDSNLVAKLLANMELSLYATKSYLKRVKTPRTLEELQNLDFVLFGSSKKSFMELSLVRAKETKRIRVPGKFRTTDMLAVKSAVLANMGIGQIPNFLAADEVKAGSLVRVLPEYVSYGSRLYLVFPQRRYLPLRVRVFIEEMSNYFQHVGLGSKGDKQ